MRVLLVSLHFVEYAVELAQALSRENTVHLVLSRQRVQQTVGNDMGRLLQGRVNYTVLDNYSFRNPKIIINFIVLIRLILNFRPDVIHHQESRDPSNLFILFFSIFIPVIGTIHDVDAHPGAGGERFFMVNFLRDLIRKYIYRKMIVHGEALRKELLNSTGLLQSDVYVVPHGCLFSFLKDSAGREIYEEEHTVLFFGRVQEYKGLRYLIEAEPSVSKVIPEFKVIIAGSGKDLTDQKHVIMNNPHFEIHDHFIPNDEVSVFFQRSAAIVLPYIEASQSGIVAMAFAFGKPVIVTNVGSLTEMVTDGVNGLVVPPGDSVKLAGAIVSLLNDKDKLKIMGKRALEMANAEFSWVNVARLTSEVYSRKIN